MKTFLLALIVALIAPFTSAQIVISTGVVTSGPVTPTSSANTVTGVAGTANQVLVNGGTAAQTGAVTFSLASNVTIGGNLTFGTSASILNGTTGSIGITATGTNQDITLTPSGTGRSIFGNNILVKANGSDGDIVGFNGGGLLRLNGSGAILAIASGTNQNITLSPTGTGSVNVGAGGVSVTTVGSTVSIKTGTNAKSGTFTLSGGAATVANTSITANSCIAGITIKTVSGARTLNPAVATTAPGTGFTVSGASATDNGTYNYFVIEVLP